MDFRKIMESEYKEILINYIKEKSEKALYLSQNFSRSSIEKGVSPEEVISLHKGVISDLTSRLSKEDILYSFDILLEVMVGYGIAYRELQSLRNKQMELKTEMEIAANVQQTLLGTKIPTSSCLDIGAISVPAKHMNGDYYHFVEDENSCISVAIADVIGKGIPAALCMSMIKYAMDSLPETRNTPSSVLGNLNRIVEQNVDPSMFVTMFYGIYNQKNHIFQYASAGHEPGFFYEAKSHTFTELHTKGLLLGVDHKASYPVYEKKIHINDMIVLLSDGVTECRTGEGFLERETLIELIKKYLHLPAQQMVNAIYKELERLQHFELRDDFTLIILRRNV